MRKQVLTIDDDPLYLNLVSDILAVKDIDVLQARTGAEALSHLASSAPSLIISDFDMPDMDGIEIHQHLQRNEKTRHIKFVFLTGSADIALSNYTKEHNLQLLNKNNIVNELLKLSEHLT